MGKIFSLGFSSITVSAAHTGAEVGLCLQRWVRVLTPIFLQNQAGEKPAEGRSPL